MPRRRSKSPAKAAAAAAAKKKSVPIIIETEKNGKFTRAQGASSGAESWLIAAAIAGAVVWQQGWGMQETGYFLCGMLAFQMVCMAGTLDAAQTWYFCTSQKLGPAKMRNASIGFAECVRPGGKPTSDHCLNLYDLAPFVTSLLFAGSALFVLTLGPITAVVRVFYPEHHEGVNSGRYLALLKLFLRHPLSVQGEGPSNGDGLASLCASESLIYPITPAGLEQGPLDRDYWLDKGAKPRFRDMFHDKVFCARFFRSHGAPCPVLVAEVENDVRTVTHTAPSDAPAQLIWKPRYSTMGLGVEHFTGWDREQQAQTNGWAPSSDPYIIEEFIQSTEHHSAEWYRCTSLWAHDEAAPKSGYIWRMRNKKGDRRVQTDILGGSYCVTKKWEPFIGPKGKSTAHDPRTGITVPLDPDVDTALTAAIGLMRKMHTCLGKELYSIGWDVLVRGTTPVFIEFNINNGFFVADHSVEEVYQMHDFFHEQFMARVGDQLVNFDPYAPAAAAAADDDYDDDDDDDDDDGNAKSKKKGRRKKKKAAAR